MRSASIKWVRVKRRAGTVGQPEACEVVVEGCGWRWPEGACLQLMDHGGEQGSWDPKGRCEDGLGCCGEARRPLGRWVGEEEPSLAVAKILGLCWGPGPGGQLAGKGGPPARPTWPLSPL